MKTAASRRCSASPLAVLMASLVGCGTATQGLDDGSTPLDTAVDASAALDANTAPDALDAAPAMDAALPADARTPPTDAVVRTDASTPTDSSTPPPPPTTALLRPDAPMPCADPAVFSENDDDATFYVYCTSMAHVWRTTDWVRFTDERSSTRFDTTGMSENGRMIGSWWAPSVIYARDLDRYVMWVSVPAAGATRGDDGWNARALAVLTATSPTGPWTFREMGHTAGAGEHFIDPFLFRDHDGRRYVFWKQYGGGVSSSIMGASLDATWRNIVAGTAVEIMNGYGGAGTWEDNVRENPAVYYNAAADRYHMLFSGGHWDAVGYATGHALSRCGPLCMDASRGGWRMVDSGDRGILQVVRAFGLGAFEFGGPGGAEFQDHAARYIVYAAAARSARGDRTRYLMRDRVQWQNAAPFVDRAGHHPLGY